MTIRLYDYWRSSAAYRVRIALGLLGRLKGDAHRGHQAGTALVDGIEGAGPDQPQGHQHQPRQHRRQQQAI